MMLSNCAGEDTWDVHWTARRSKLVNPKGNQPWIFTGGTDAKAPILWPPDAKSQLIGGKKKKNPDAEKDWGQEEKGAPEDEMVSLTQWTWVWVNFER